MNISKTKRWLLSGAGILLLLAANTFFGWVRMPWMRPSALEAVPVNTALILEVHRPAQWESRTAAFVGKKALYGIPVFGRFEKEIHGLDSMFRACGFAESWEACNIVSAIIPNGSNNFSYLHILENFSLRDIQNLAYKADGFQTTTYRFKGQELFEWRNKNGLKYCFTQKKGLLVISQLPLFVEYAVDRLNDVRAGVRRNSDFGDISRRSQDANADLTLYADFESLPLLLDALSPKRSDIGGLGKSFSWGALDLFFEKDGIRLGGNIFAQPSSTFWQALRAQTITEKSSIEEVLPDNISILNYFGTSKSKTFCRDMRADESESFKKYIMPWLGGEFAYAISEPSTPNIAENAFLIFETEDMEAAEATLEKCRQQFGSEEPVAHMNFMVKRLLVKDLFQGLFGEAFSIWENPYYTTIGKYVVFGNTSDGIKLWIDKYNFNLTLAGNDNYLRASQMLETRGQFSVYVNTKRLFQILSAYAKADLAESMSAAFNKAQELSPALLRLSSKGRRFAIEGYIGYSPGKVIQTSMAWRTELQAPAQIAPSIVTDPQTHKAEFLIQDTEFNLYRLASDGQVKWTRPFRDKIFPQFHQIDYYGNNTYQTYLNTPGALYLIDHDGKDALPSLQLPSAASCGTLMVDFMGGPKVFAPCTNGNIYGYYKDGAPLEGWSPQPDVGKLAYPPQSYTNDGKECILVVNTAGRVRAYDRSGNPKFPAITLDGISASPAGIDEVAKRIAVADRDGVVSIVNFEGATFKLRPELPGTGIVKFAYSDVMGDDKKDYIFLRGKELVVYYYKGKDFVKGWSCTLSEEANELFAVSLKQQPKAYIGLLSSKGKKVWMVGSSGKVLPGFPLPGTTPFRVADVFGDQSNVLVVANEKVVYAYKLAF